MFSAAANHGILAHMHDVGFLSLPPADGVFLVGGGVRDLLLGRRPADIDLVVTGDARAYARRLAAVRGGRMVDIGTPRFRLYRIAAAGQLIDVSPVAGADIREDLHRRDFTINSLALNIATGELIDIASGREDLAAGVIRMVSAEVFRADPVRLIRAFRLSAQFDFSIEPQTLAAIAGDASRIAAAAGERIREELFKLLAAEGCGSALGAMYASGVLFAVLPEPAAPPPGGIDHRLAILATLEALRRQLTPRFDSLEHALSAKDRIFLKLAALLHPLSDPLLPAQRLKLSARDATRLATLLRLRRRTRALFEAPQASPREAVQLFHLASELTPALLLLAGADLMVDPGAAALSAEASNLTAGWLQRYFREYLPILRTPRPIGGGELMREFDLKPSPLFREILDALEEERLARGGLTREEALRWVGDFLQARA